MVYITLQKEYKPFQLSWEDILMDKEYPNGLIGESDRAATITRKMESVPVELMNKVNIDRMIFELSRFCDVYKDLINKDLSEYYTHFKLPKASGGWRQIDAPIDPLKSAQSILANILQCTCGGLYHTAAFGYVEKRSTVDVLKKHQRNESEWFLHTDFSGFFPNTTIEFVVKMLKMIFPFSEIMKNEQGKKALTDALSIGFYRGGLVQGSPLSPYLTNLMFVPIDYTLNTWFSHHKMVYTRYADDINISAKECFPWQEQVKKIREVLGEFEAVYEIKPEKTHFGSRKGKNWILGLMLNADNNITVGHVKKSQFRGALTNFILDTKNGKPWPADEVMHLKGQLSYYEKVEKDYFLTFLARVNRKWGVDVEQMMKEATTVATM